MVPTVSSTKGSGTRVLALLDGSQEHQDAALAAADLLASTPRAEVTVLAPADVAFTGSPQASPNGNGLVQLSRRTQSLVETVRLIEGRDLSTKIRTTEGSLVQEAARLAEAHDAVILPRSKAELAEQMPVPVLLV